ncbi:type II CAAX endopeptidase family protein [Staphylococcus equorum]|uniref:CAAX prenyl protease 2/Lysostaphin resistance protein A-like domain-containing protein n=1 Tax=Staphylococcus equorum TaxID=246432 RepID=A0AAP7IF31_9STAP|nr:type II CAAX endopeptidase family protein [Staphylococcus equorum]OEK58917.1 hypothetical protein ASS94_00920 [Staphylococcus equorum]
MAPDVLTEQSEDKDKQEKVGNVRPKGNRIVNILLFIGLMIFAQLPMILALSTIGFSIEDGGLGLTIGLALGFVVLTAFVVWVVRSYYLRHSYEENKQHFKKKDVGLNILWFVGLRVIVLVFSYLMLWVYGDEVSENDKVLMQNLENINHIDLKLAIALVVFFIAITFVAPYLEELVFRGIFKETIFSKFTLWLPLVLSSAIFSINHASANIIGFILYMLMGVVLYLAYRRRGNIKDSMMVHMLNNAFASVSIIIMLFVEIYG